MTGEDRTIDFRFELEADDNQADLDQRATALRDAVSALAGVTDAHVRIPEPTRQIDPVTVAAVLLTVRLAVKTSGDIVESLNDLVTKTKQLADNLGLPRLWIWLHTKKIAVNDLTTKELQELAAEATPKDT